MFRLHSCRHLHINRKMILFMDSIFLGIQIRMSPIAINHMNPFSSSKSKRKCSNFSKADSRPEIVLKEMLGSMDDNVTDMSSWFLKYELAIYKVLNISTGCDSLLSHKRKVSHNFLCDDLIRLVARNPEFDNVVKCFEDNITLLPSRRYPVLLKSFKNLLVPDDNPFMVKLFRICVDNMNIFDIHELALFTQCAFMTGDISVCAQIIQNLQSRIESHSIPFTSSASDLCLLFRSIGHLMSQKMLDLCIAFIVEYIAHRPALDFSSIQLLCELAEGSSGEAREKIQERILQSGILSMKVSLDLQDIDLEACSVIGRHLDVLFSHTSLLSKIRHLCCPDLTAKSSSLTPVEAHKLAFFLPTRQRSSFFVNTESKETKLFDKHKRVLDLFSTFIKDADNHGLFMFLKLFSQTKLPWRTVYELHDRLVTVFDERSFEEQQWLFEQDEEIDLLLYHFVTTVVSSGHHISPKLFNLVSRRYSPSCCVFPVPTSKISLLVHSLTSDLFDDKQKSHQEIDMILSLLNQMHISSLTLLGAKLEMGSQRGTQPQSRHVKAQVKFLARQSRRCLREKVAALRRLPASCLWQDCDDIWNLNQGMFGCRGIMQTIVSCLEPLTRKPDECNNLRAIEILSFAAMHLTKCEPQLFENLLQFIYTQEPMPIRAFLSLLQVLSSIDYCPNDFDKFTSICLSYQQEVRQRNLLSLAQQVQLAHCLSVFNIFDREVVASIFSSKFLSAVDKELEELQQLHGQGADLFRTCLFLLNRSIVIECPTVPVSLVTTSSPEISRYVLGYVPDIPLEFSQSVGRIFQNSPHIQERTYSPYGHRIDALVCLDENGDVVSPNMADMDKCYKLAFLYLSSHDLCFKSNERHTGQMKAAIRQLKLLGYFVVEVPFQQLFAMEMNTNDAVDNFFKEQIIHAIGPRFLFN